MRALVRDPLYDAYCWRNCAGNDVLVRSAPRLAVSMDHVWLGATIALGVVAVIGAAVRRRTVFLAAGALAACAKSAYAVALLKSTRESPQRFRFETLFYARAFTVLVFAAALLGGMAWTWRRRQGIVRLARLLASGPAPGQLQAVLGETLGDPTLEVVYWLPRLNSYVDRNGRSVDLGTDDARLVTPIVRNGKPVAAVVHDPSITDSAFERELGAAARLAVENERLHAEVQVQLEALRRSRMRITERGDAERRRLERDLHDGAQQRLLALFYDLRLARSSAAGELAVKLDAATEEAQLALEELRDLAHGIYPAILTEAGLRPALASLADDAPLPVELTTTNRRFDVSVEAAVYVAAREAIDDAAARGAAWLRIVVEENDERLSIEIDDDGGPRTTDLVHVHDRIGALGGTVNIGPRTLIAVVPCA